MKEFLWIGFFMLLFTAPVWAQTFSEWFRQKKTQIKYLQKQIAALEVYKGIVEKGYRVAKDGANLISWVKQGDLDLHTEHFSSYGYVNPSILHDSSLKWSLRYSDMAKKKAEQIRKITAERRSDKVDWSAFGAAYADNIIAGCDEKMKLLAQLTTNAQFNMDDHERASAIYTVWEWLRDWYQMADAAETNFDQVLKSYDL